MELETKVMEIIDKVRPYLIRDGGNIEVIKIEDGIVYVKMLGQCDGCFAIDVTLKQGIERMLLENVPGVVGVVNI